MLYLPMRIGLSLWAALVLAIVPAETGPDRLPRPYLGIAPVNQGLAGWLLGPWQRFDTLHYIHLAIYGYEPGTVHTVFPPLYPLLIRLAGGLLNGQYLLAALLVSNLCAIGYLMIFLALARQEIGQAAARSQVYVLLYPWAFFLLAGYSEPLFLMLVGLMFLVMQRRCTWAAGLFGALAALTRLQGGTLTLVLLFEHLRQRGFRLWPPPKDALGALLPSLASLGFLAWRAWSGIEPTTVTYATLWQHKPAWPWVGMITNVRNMLAGTAHPTDYLDLIVVWVFIGLTAIAWRRLGSAYAFYMTQRYCSTSHMCACLTRCPV